MNGAVFVDASAWIAITNRNDTHHKPAVEIFRRLLYSQAPLVTTNWTTHEAPTLVKSRLGYRQASLLWTRIRARSIVESVWIDERLESEALEMFWRYRDKTWGVVDCSSLVVMRALECRRVFAFDAHFVEASRQFGFTVLTVRSVV